MSLVEMQPDYVFCIHYTWKEFAVRNWMALRATTMWKQSAGFMQYHWFLQECLCSKSASLCGGLESFITAVLWEFSNAAVS